MNRSKAKVLGVLVAILTFVLPSTSAFAQFEFAPVAGAGVFSAKSTIKPGFTTDLGVSARYTFFPHGVVSFQARLDVLYSYQRNTQLTRNLFQNPELKSHLGFVFDWQDHKLRLPLSLGLRFNEVFNGSLTLRAGAYYQRGIGGKARCTLYPFENLVTPFEFNTYATESFDVKRADNTVKRLSTIAQNESGFGLLFAADYRVWDNLELSLYYMGDMTPTWPILYSNSYIHTSVKPQAFKLGVSYWF